MQSTDVIIPHITPHLKIFGCGDTYVLQNRENCDIIILQGNIADVFTQNIELWDVEDAVPYGLFYIVWIMYKLL